MLEYFNEAPYSVTICDKDGKILEMNETQTLFLFLVTGSSSSSSSS